MEGIDPPKILDFSVKEDLFPTDINIFNSMETVNTLGGAVPVVKGFLYVGDNPITLLKTLRLVVSDPDVFLDRTNVSGSSIVGLPSSMTTDRMDIPLRGVPKRNDPTEVLFLHRDLFSYMKPFFPLKIPDGPDCHYVIPERTTTQDEPDLSFPEEVLSVHVKPPEKHNL